MKNIWTYDKVTNSEIDVQKLTYEKLMTYLGETFFRIGDPDFL